MAEPGLRSDGVGCSNAVEPLNAKQTKASGAKTWICCGSDERRKRYFDEGLTIIAQRI